MLIRKERSIPWTREYRFERAIPPLLSAYLASRLSGRFSGDLSKLHFFTNEATPVFNGRSKKYTPMVDTIFEREKKNSIRFFSYFRGKKFFFFFSNFWLFLKNFSRYILRNVQTLYFIFEIFRFFFEHFSNFFFFFSPFLNYSLFPLSSLSYLLFFPKCFYFPRLHSFCILYVSVLTSNPCISFHLIFPRCTTFKETNVKRKRNPRCVSRRKGLILNFLRLRLSSSNDEAERTKAKERIKIERGGDRIIGRAPFRNKCLAAFRRRRKKIERMDGRSVNEKRMEMKFDWRVETGGEV